VNTVQSKKKIWIKNDEGPLLVKEVYLQNNTCGWLVVDSMGNGQAVGGMRLGENITLDEVKELAAEMTQKFSFLNLPIGGAKAGICCPNPLSEKEREELFFSFGKGLGHLLHERTYLPGADFGTYPVDIQWLFRGAGIVKNGHEEAPDAGFYTAVSVFSALQAASSFLGIPLAGARIGIQGLGKVGLKMLQLVYQHRLKVVGVSTRRGALYSSGGLDPEQLLDLADRYGDELVFHYHNALCIPCEDLFEQDMEILCPCAGSYPINMNNIHKIKAKIIVPGCNVAATTEVEDRLFHRGITFLPGFVCNSGGVLCYLLSNYGFLDEEITNFLTKGIQQKVSSLLVKAKKRGESPATTALSIVKENQERFVHESEARLKGHVSLGLARFRRSGTKEMIRTALWPFVQSALSDSISLRKQMARKILFNRFFRA
jgi:glutamate dehydrogenase/leucine dehydrogenase